MNKYKLSEKTFQHRGLTLHYIIALKDIPARGVFAGDRGGYVECHSNLSQYGSCWIERESKVYAGATIDDHAYVNQFSDIRGNVRVDHHAQVSSSSLLGYTPDFKLLCTQSFEELKGRRIRVSGHAQVCKSRPDSADTIINYWEDGLVEITSEE